MTFLSDVIESDGARLRGLPPGYTQILINGEKVPGSNADRSFFLDRIPAELIDRVEIVRSSSARRTGDAVAGTLNIKLRDGYELDGGYLRAGGFYYDDKELEPSVGGVFGGALGPGRFLLGANFQGRHNPKKKFSLRYDDSPENNPNFATDDFDNREDQIDTRDGKDYSFNATYDIKGDTTDFSDQRLLCPHRPHRDRAQPANITTRPAFNWPDPCPTARSGSVDNANIAMINQDNYSVNGKLAHRWSAGETSLQDRLRLFRRRAWFETEYEVEFDRALPRFTGDQTRPTSPTRNFRSGSSMKSRWANDTKLLFGGLWQDKDRETAITEAPRDRYNLSRGRSAGL